MFDDKALKAALQQHWDYSGKDEDRAHEIYHDDAILEFPQSRERFEGVKNFIEWRKAHPAQIDFKLRKIRGRDDLVVTEYSISYDGRSLAVLREHHGIRRRQGRARAHLRHGGMGRAGLA